MVKVYEMKEAGFKLEEAIQAGLKVIAKNKPKPIPFKEPDNRPRKIILAEEDEKNTPAPAPEPPPLNRKIILLEEE
jgi:hypothetical protein